MATKIAPGEVSDLDPYTFMAVIGKRVIHPGGRASTQALLRRAQITGPDRVLDVGCGVATTAIEIARRHGALVTAVDVVDHPGNLGGSDSWEDAGPWRHRGSTQMSSASAR
jgi:SAM-dependent methyltransferase